MAETITPTAASEPAVPAAPAVPAPRSRDSFGGMYAVDDGGFVVTRTVVCEMRGCGRTYTQRQLSTRFAEMVARAGRGAQEATLEQIPDGFVPVFCPRCESQELGALARQLRLMR